MASETRTGVEVQETGGWELLAETQRRFSQAMIDPGDYLRRNGEAIAGRLERKLDLASQKAILFSVYSGKGLVWAIDQFSRQETGDEKMRMVVFQNGFNVGTGQQAQVESITRTTGVEYFGRPEALGAWGARSFAMRNFGDQFGGNYPETLMTFDEDTAPVYPKFCQQTWNELATDPKLGVVYSPAIFVTEKGGIDQAKLLAYKAITLTAQRIKTALGRFHTVGSNAVFSGQALREIMEDPKWTGIPLGDYETILEDDIAFMLLNRGYKLQTSFSLNRITYTSGDKLTKMGVGDYLRRVALVNVPDVGVLGKLRSLGAQEYGAMYGKKGEATSGD